GPRRGIIGGRMIVAIPVFDRITALDAIGPYEVLSRLPGAEVKFVSFETGPVRTDTGMLGIEADHALDDVPDPELIVHPGGFGTRALMRDERMLSWLRRAHERGKVITAAGVSAGIDMALHLAARIAGAEVAQAIQLAIEYDPQPPFDSGSPAKATPEVVDLVRRGEAAQTGAE